MQTASNATDIADILVTAILGVAGIYLAHSYRRQQALRVAEKRLAAYAELWGTMSFASPVRLAEWVAQPLTHAERARLFHDFTAWYYARGNGMFLGDGTRAVYLRVKDNLVCPIGCYEPESIREKLLRLSSEEQERARGYLSIRQLSLLRNRMKADLNVYGLPYHVELGEDDAALLRSCGENPAAMSWAGLRRRAAPACGQVRIFPEQGAEHRRER